MPERCWGMNRRMYSRPRRSKLDLNGVIGKLIAAFRAAQQFDRTLILVTADHGGYSKIYGSDDPRDQTIPWIVQGPGIRRGHRIQQTIHTYDTAATVTYAWGLKVPTTWQGQPVREAFLRTIPLRLELKHGGTSAMTRVLREATGREPDFRPQGNAFIVALPRSAEGEHT